MQNRFKIPFFRFSRLRKILPNRIFTAFFTFPAVALAFAEAVAARNPTAIFHVVSAHPGSAAFSYLWILALFAFLYSAIGNLAPAAVLVSFFILGSSHVEKLRSL